MSIVPRNKSKKQNFSVGQLAKEYALAKAMDPTVYEALIPHIANMGSKMARWYNTPKAIHPLAGNRTLTAPVAQGIVTRGRKPQFAKTSGGIVVTHRELMCSVNGTSAGFQLNGGAPGIAYRINPKNMNLWPYLNSIANNFDEFKVLKLAFVYLPSCSTTETGALAMGWDKDAEDNAPGSRGDITNLPVSTTGPFWAESAINLPIDNKWRFSGGNAGEVKLTHYGQFFFATQTATNNLLGDIMVEYSIALRTPSYDGVSQWVASLTPTSVSYQSDNSSQPLSFLAGANSLTMEFFTNGYFRVAIVGNSTGGAISATTATAGVINYKNVWGTDAANSRFIAEIEFRTNVSAGGTNPTVVFNGITAWSRADIIVYRIGSSSPVTYT